MKIFYKRCAIQALALVAVVFVFLNIETAVAQESDATVEREDQIGRIVGGRPSAEGRWPSTVALVRAGRSLFLGQYCAGTIIHQSWVLTAAHCVDGLTVRDIQVATGVTDLFLLPAELIDIAQIVTHPRASSVTFDFDYALLRLAQPTNQPTTALYGGNSDLAGSLATTVGWGSTDRFGNFFPSDLMEVNLPVVSNTRCRAVNPDETTDRMLCAGNLALRRDACFGDSGGPLFVSVLGRTLQAGITSFGFGSCANLETYGVWARVSAGSNFIRQIVPSARIVDEQLIQTSFIIPPIISTLLD